jgi:putative adenylate-forming enzyme
VDILYRLKKIKEALNAYAIWRDMRTREGWSREQLLAYQSRKLDSLVRHAVAKSPFYKEFYKGVDLSGPLDTNTIRSLPVLTKKMVMENFDRFVTDRRVTLSSIYSHMDGLDSDRYYHGRYRVLTTAGSSGLKGVFIFGSLAWSTILAAVMRGGAFMGVSPYRRMRIGSIGSSSPQNLSYRRAISMDFGLHKVRQLLVTSPLEKLVTDLNGFQPQYIHAYPSMATLLAEEQIEGKLHITPEYILTGGELVTEAMRRAIRRAWGIRPFQSYSATEGLLAVECDHHRGMHLFEDLCIVEVVDDENRPVPDGVPGRKILLTNLFLFREPLIRYEISDMICIDPEPCSCGRPFRLISAVIGRNDDIFYLEGTSGEPTPVHPMNFHSVLDPVARIKQYQVVLGDDSIIIMVVPAGEWDAAESGEIAEAVKKKLQELNIKPPRVAVRTVNAIERDDMHMGKKVIVSRELEGRTFES